MAKLEIGKRYWMDDTHQSHGELQEINTDGSIALGDIKGKHIYAEIDDKVNFLTDISDENDFELFTP